MPGNFTEPMAAEDQDTEDALTTEGHPAFVNAVHLCIRRSLEANEREIMAEGTPTTEDIFETGPTEFESEQCSRKNITSNPDFETFFEESGTGHVFSHPSEMPCPAAPTLLDLLNARPRGLAASASSDSGGRLGRSSIKASRERLKHEGSNLATTGAASVALLDGQGGVFVTLLDLLPLSRNEVSLEDVTLGVVFPKKMKPTLNEQHHRTLARLFTYKIDRAMLKIRAAGVWKPWPAVIESTEEDCGRAFRQALLQLPASGGRECFAGLQLPRRIVRKTDLEDDNFVIIGPLDNRNAKELKHIRIPKDASPERSAAIFDNCWQGFGGMLRQAARDSGARVRIPEGIHGD